MNIDLRQLEYFLMIAECGSLTGAAMRLHVSQPSLSKAMRALEERLGVPLFERLPRGIELTAFGEALARHARRIHIQLHDAMTELEGMREGHDGFVSLGAGPSWLRRLLPLAIARCQAAHPRIRVSVTGGFDDRLLRELRAGELDLVVAELPESEAMPDLACIPLADDDLGIACRKDHPLAGRAGLRLHDLVAYPWVMPKGNTRARRRMEALFLTRNLPVPKAAIEADSMAYILAALRYSDGLTYTTPTATLGAEGQDLTMLDVPEIAGSRVAGVIHRAHVALPPPARIIVDMLCEICRNNPRN